MNKHRVCVQHDLELESYYPSAHVINGDDLMLNEILLEKQNAIVVYRRTFPSKDIFDRSAIPVIVFTRREPPKWARDVAHITDGRSNLFTEIDKWMKGEEIKPSSVPPILFWSMIRQNAVYLWPSGIPQIVFDIDVVFSRYQTKYFYDLVNMLRPDSFVPLKWRRKKKEENA